MSTRSTTRWTETTGECHGEAGLKGERGEGLAAEILRSLGFEVHIFHREREIQTRGVDLVIVENSRLFLIDVKNNLKTRGDVGVEWRKLFRSHSHFWIHINEEDPSDYVIYPVKPMRDFLNNKEDVDWSKDTIWVKREDANNLQWG